MPVELRKRANRVSYAVAYPGLDDETDEASNALPEGSASKHVGRAESVGSESDFAPGSGDSGPDEEELGEEAEGADSDDEIGAAGVDDDSGSEVLPPQPLPRKGKGKEKASSRTPEGPHEDGTPTKRKSLPTLGSSNQAKGSIRGKLLAPPGVRPTSIYLPQGKNKRLVRRPALFGESAPELERWTTSPAAPTIGDRIAKAWAHDLGNGPVWQLVEDRGWYAEAHSAEEIIRGGRTHAMDVDPPQKGGESGPKLQEDSRPRVYQELKIDANSIRVMTKEEAAAYLPTDKDPGNDGLPQPSRAIPCYFGLYGSQTRLEVSPLESHRIDEFIEGSQAHVFNAGAPVWGLDWCPIHVSDSLARASKQYLAIAPYPSYDHSPTIGSRLQRPAPACIQIWSLSPTDPENPVADDVGVVKCELVLGIDSGPAHQIKWCPLPAHDSWTTEHGSSTRKLGILGGTFGDGSLTFWLVPDPTDVSTSLDSGESSTTAYVHLKAPLLRLEHDDTPLWSFDWANSGMIVAGGTNGNIVVYHIKDALLGRHTGVLLPYLYISVHQAAIRSIAWIKVPTYDSQNRARLDKDPSIVASTSYDGSIVLTDIREQIGNEWLRTRDTIHTIAYAPYAGGFVSVESEIQTKWYNISPNMLARGHVILETRGPVWDLSASDYHPYVATASTDGCCYTASMYKSSKRGSGLPTFAHRIFQMDYNRTTGEWRMMENFLPLEATRKDTVSKSGNAKQTADPIPEHDREGSGAWPPEVGVHRVTWNTSNGMMKSQLLASATASGLCRIDSLWGRFYKDKVPYGSVEKLRAEEESGPVEDDDMVDD